MGFLCIVNGMNLLDVLVVYLEVYFVVDVIVNIVVVVVNDLIGNMDLLCKFNFEEFVSDVFGVFIVKDIFKELDKFGCDFCFEFKIVVFKEGVEIIVDLKFGMILEGVVSNVVNFGVFVDVGVY